MVPFLLSGTLLVSLREYIQQKRKPMNIAKTRRTQMHRMTAKMITLVLSLGTGTAAKRHTNFNDTHFFYTIQ